MLALGGLGRPVVARAGSGGFAALYALSMLGGGLAFGVMTASPAPMIGASGAIFGLAAALLVWDWHDQRRTKPKAAFRRLVQLGLGLALFNLVMWLVLGGGLAWQTHLGGAAVGAAFALAYDGFRLAKTRS